MTTAARAYLIPIILLGLMFMLMAASSLGESAIMDELAHIPAAYSYIFLKDYRLNPEHPPLIKDLAAIPLVFTDLTFPTNVKSWTEDINGQWVQGAIFLYESGNDPDRILRLMRFPMMLLTIFFGWLFWGWARKHFGERVALLAHFLFAFSPTLIAHSRYVTTDIAAAFAFFIGIIGFLRYLGAPTGKNILIAGIAFGVAQLLKFSLILLIPIYGVLLIAWAASRTELSWKSRAAVFVRLALRVPLIIGAALVLIWAVYLWHVWNYPMERNIHDAETTLQSFRVRPMVEFTLALIRNEYLRPLGQYFLGLLMVLQRASGGNTQYFLGEVTNVGSRAYFPILYALKETLALHILTLIALVFALKNVAASRVKSLDAILTWIREHFIQFASLVFIAVYWTSSITSPLNIGVRHVLPTFPFIFVLVAKGIVSWLHSWRHDDVHTWGEWLRRIWTIYILSLPRYLVVTALLLWMAASTAMAFPYFLSYFNEAGGGVPDGYQFAVDSNYDWGQDLKHLGAFTKERDIDTIRLDYFGGGNPRHYLGDAYESWWSSRGHPPEGGWFAISATFLMGARGETVGGFTRKPEDSYLWLRPYEPTARAGTSIFIYHLPPPSGYQ